MLLLTKHRYKFIEAKNSINNSFYYNPWCWYGGWGCFYIFIWLKLKAFLS